MYKRSPRYHYTLEYGHGPPKFGSPWIYLSTYLPYILTNSAATCFSHGKLWWYGMSKCRQKWISVFDREGNLHPCTPSRERGSEEEREQRNKRAKVTEILSREERAA